MYVDYGNNEYHHLTIQEIKDRTEKKIPNLYLYCTGKTLMRDTSSATGFKIVPYRITVECRKGLIDYVYSELSVKESIFVIGHTVTVEIFKGRYQRNLIAKCIYREDWMKFFSNNNSEDLQLW